MISTKDIAWAAGFIDGEGTIQGANTGKFAMTVGQQDSELLFRLARIFGGYVTERTDFTSVGVIRPGDKYTHRRLGFWRVYGAHAASIAMTLYPLLSTKRRAQVRRTLEPWIKAGITKKRRAPGKRFIKPSHI